MSGIVPIPCAAAAEGVVQLPADSKRLSRLLGAWAHQAARRTVLEHVALGHHRCHLRYCHSCCCHRRLHLCHHPCRRRLPVTLVAIALDAVTIALFVARHPRCRCHPSHRCPCPLCCPPPSLPTPWTFPPLPSSSLPSSSAARSCHSSLPTVVVVWLPSQHSLTSHCPPLPIPLLVDCCSPSPSPLPLSPLLAHHPCCHRSCFRCHRPLCCTPPLKSPAPHEPVPPGWRGPSPQCQACQIY